MERRSGVDSRPVRNPRAYALCGIVAPIFFAVMVLVEGYMVAGYSQISQPISDLGAYALYGANATIQNLNFWIFGILVVVFAFGLGRGLPRSRVLFASLVLFGVMVFLAGMFPDQPFPLPGAAHALVSGVAFISIILCQLLLWRRLRNAAAEEEKAWGRYRTYSLLSGLLSVVLLVYFIIIVPLSSPIFGVGQRIFIGTEWLWIELVAVRLLQTAESK